MPSRSDFRYHGDEQVRACRVKHAAVNRMETLSAGAGSTALHEAPCEQITGGAMTRQAAGHGLA